MPTDGASVGGLAKSAMEANGKPSIVAMEPAAVRRLTYVHGKKNYNGRSIDLTFPFRQFPGREELPNELAQQNANGGWGIGVTATPH